MAQKKFELQEGETCPDAMIVVEENGIKYCVREPKKGKLHWPLKK